MNRNEYLSIIKEVIYLCGCAVNDLMPDKSRVEQIDLDLLYKASAKHSLDSLVSFALEKVKMSNERFTESRGRTIRKIAILEINKDLLFEQLEKEKIWYMPLKGAVLKDIYPFIGMRQMSDYDILIDPSRAEKLRDIMLGIGFRVEVYGLGSHDIYYKDPVSNFEMHRELFGTQHDSKLYEYYKDVKSRLIKDQGNNYGFHFSNEDFYIYNIAHSYKHFIQNGVGLRSLVDVYVFINKYKDQLDFEYIEKELTKLGIKDWEHQFRTLALDLFSGGSVDFSDDPFLDYIIFSGTGGTIGNRVKNDVEKLGGGTKGKLKYVFRRFFIPMGEIKQFYPFIYKHKILLPLIPFIKVARALTVGRKRAFVMIKQLLKK